MFRGVLASSSGRDAWIYASTSGSSPARNGWDISAGVAVAVGVGGIVGVLAGAGVAVLAAVVAVLVDLPPSPPPHPTRAAVRPPGTSASTLLRE